MYSNRNVVKRFASRAGSTGREHLNNKRPHLCDIHNVDRKYYLYRCTREYIIIISGSIIVITKIHSEENRKALITIKYIYAVRPDLFFEYLRNRISSRLIS
jgi:hypothetical protein